jgi:hypothetical protein
MVQRLLAFRDIPFADYQLEVFLEEVRRRARIVRSEQLASGTRTLIWYDRSA